ncbi:MAG TPA: penicillin-binding protein 2 [Stellaceae bacterium]|nr:penicillin-binding protein 2 [Stellaceae bacterium]
MSAAFQFDDNPCRPRHFKPPPCMPVVPDGPAKRALDGCRPRLLIMSLAFIIAFVVIAGRLIQVTLLPGSITVPRIARFDPVPPPPPGRADIVDRNGKLLATTLESPSLYANPRQIIDAADVAQKLVATLPGLNRNEVYAKLTSGKGFVWIKRHLTPDQAYAVNQLGLPGLQFQHEERRVYPYGALLSHVVGFTGIDDNGEAGIERGLDSSLRGRQESVQLSIDLRLQYILHEELARVVDDFTARGGAGLIMNVNTGEILAMVSLPDFDPSHPDTLDPRHPEWTVAERMFNRVTLGDYEIGSVFKIFTTAMGLDSGATSMTGRFDATYPIHIGRFTISDYHGKHRWETVPEILMYSSNIGEAKIALAVGADRQQEYLRRFGLMSAPTLELKEIGRPHYPAKWREVNVMTIGFGHGISETPLQIASAGSALVNGGILRPATLLKLPPGGAPQGTRVISAETSDHMRKLLRMVVLYGTGEMVDAPGYVVGGKTGTADKVEGKHYAERKLLSSFLGVFPMTAPKYLVLVMVDEPHPNKSSHGYATAGWTAAPAVGRTIVRIAPLLGVQPVDESSPSIVQALTPESMQGKRIEAY